MPPPSYQAPQPAAAPQPYYQPAQTAPPQDYGYADWSSVEVQPGEASLGSWFVALRGPGMEFSGTLTVTDRRILFKPKVAGTSLLGMVLSQMQSLKDRNTVVLGKHQISAVHAEKGMINTNIVVTMVDGGCVVFTRGLMSADPIIAAIRQR